MTTRGAARAFLAPLALLAMVGGVVLHPPTARAQTPAIGMTLLSQTPWTTLDDPGTRRVESELRLAVVATNLGQAQVGELRIAVTLGTAFQSRFQFESAITEGPSSAAYTTSVRIDGRLEPGTARTLKVQLDMGAVPAVSSDDSGVYPMLVELRSNGETVGALTTAVINMVRTPEQPMRLSWWTELATPIAFDPSGRLTDPTLEAAVMPEGRLGAQAVALVALTDAQGPRADIDVVVEPALLDQLQRMAAGYVRADGTEVPPGEGPAAAAASLLERLAAVAGTEEVQISRSPFSSPSIPAMLDSGLQTELAHQDDAGMRVLRRVLGVEPTTSVARPPGGFLDDAAVERLAATGVAAVLADPDEIERLPVGDLQFAPVATAPMSTPGGATTLVLPDPGTQRLLTRADLLADPVRAAQIVLAHLAVIWKEEPIPAPQPDGTPTVRGVAVAPPEDLPTAMWDPLMQRIAGAPFLTPTHAEGFVADVTPPTDPSVLRAPDTLTFSAPYAAEVLRLRRDTDAYASMLVEDSAVPERLRTDLLYATSAEYLVPNEPAGRPWLDAVAEVTEPAFAGVRPSVRQVFTFTSREGTIPLRMGDPGPAPLRVWVQLQSSQFEFPQGDRQEVVLERPDQIVSFPVVAKAAGRNPIRVVVRSPSGEVINERTITVASTALNRIALLITVIAAVGLVALYGRRQVRRRRAAW